MKSSTLIFAVCILLSVIPFLSRAQQIGMEIDFFGYADNREYKSIYTEDKTFFGTIVSPKLYLALDSNHRIYGGLNYNQDFGMHPENKERVSPIAYYNFRNQNFDFAIGHIPRHERLADVPRLVLADTFMYDRPNMEGMYLAFQNKNVKQAIYIDWLSKQGQQHRERFLVGLSGKYTFGSFYAANDALLYHHALTSREYVDENIRDNGVGLFRLGADLSRHSFLDSLTIDAGMAIGFDRIRSEYDLHFMKGFIANLHGVYKQFFVHHTLYLGDPQQLPNGDPFYNRETYNRLDLGWTPFRKGNIEAKFVASFHFAPDNISNQQAFTIRYLFGKTFRP